MVPILGIALGAAHVLTTAEACAIGATIGAGTVLGFGALSKNRDTVDYQNEAPAQEDDSFEAKELSEAVDLVLRILRKRRK